VCYQIDEHAPLVFTWIDKVLLHLVTRREPDRLHDGGFFYRLLPNLLCGGRQAAYSRVPRLSGMNEDLQRGLVDQLLSAAEETASSIGSRSFSFLYVDADDAILRERLRAANFAEFFHTYRCVLDISWSDFDGYLGQFSSYRRVVIRRELRKLGDAGVVTEIRQLTEDLMPILVELELQLVRKYGGPRTREQLERNLRTLAVYLPHESVVAMAACGDVIRGFAALAHWRQELYPRNVSFDYGFQRKLPLYFAVVFYEPVKYAIRNGVKRIEYGIGSLDAKISRGCRGVPLYGYVKPDEYEQNELKLLLAGLREQVPIGSGVDP